MKNNYNSTVKACFVGYVVQAIINNFVPLLFLTFQSTYDIPLSKITLLVTINFAIQLIVDLVSVSFVDRIGYRASMILAHICSAGGLILLTILPELLTSAYIGILLSVITYAIGGGLLEVLVSPIVEACPSDNKGKAMSMLHSFYCWGHAGVVLLSTIFFHFVGINNWKILAVIWSLIPIINAVIFTKVPIAPLLKDGEKGLKIPELLKSRMFWALFIMMFCSGASEQSVSQWASTFAEQGLKITKSAGDLAGPMAFAILMGASRALYGKYGHRIHLDHFMIFSCCLCVVSYLGIALLPLPFLNLIACALCGLSVGIMWPGTFSKASTTIPNGGTAMFALLALAGDVGCSAGPTAVGMVSGMFNDNLKAGVLAGVVFPLFLLGGILICNRYANHPPRIKHKYN